MLTFACGPSAYPGKADVVKAQAKWCDGLASLHGGEDWEHLGDCKGEHPTASAAYLAGMSECFPRRLEDLGEADPDMDLVLQDCETEVSVNLPLEDEAGVQAMKARCQRAKRCEDIPEEDCMETLQSMESAQRATFTMMYNAHALAKISDCLASSSCQDDEEAGREACYADHAESLLWFPD